MAVDETYVRVPEEMYRQLEKRAMRATELEEALIAAGAVLAQYRVTGVMTIPPTGRDAKVVFEAVESIVNFAKGIK